MSAPPSAAALDNIVVVLVATQHPGNIGSAARAMLAMGLERLRLVRPQRFPDEQATALATHASRVLDQAQVYDRLEAAVEDCAWVIGSSARPRHLGDEPMTPWEAAPRLVQAASQARVALVFGCERTGLTNEELDRCHATTRVPTHPEHCSLNLANAVQIYAYELRKAAAAVTPVSAKHDHPWYRPPTTEQVERFFEHLERVLLATGFLDPANPRLLMRRLRQLVNRARPDLNELNLMRGILTTVERPKRRHWPENAGKNETSA